MGDKTKTQTPAKGSVSTSTNLPPPPPALLVSHGGTVSGGNKWLNGTPMAATKRTNDQVLTSHVIIQPKDRGSLDKKELIKHQENVKAGLSHKFKLLEDFDPDMPLDRLKSVHSVDNLIMQLKRSFAANGMTSDFVIPAEMEYDNSPGIEEHIPKAGAAEIDLFVQYGESDLTIVKQHCRFMCLFGPEYQLENLQWGAEKILNSCDASLRHKITEITKNFPELESGSIVIFKVMMTLVISSTSAALRTLTKKLDNLKLTDFDGENVSKCSSFVRGAVSLMESNKALPKDIEEMTFTIFKYCSTPDFVAHVSFLSNLKLLNGFSAIDNINLSYDDLLLSMEGKYTDLKAQDKWLAKCTPAESSFTASSSKSKGIDTGASYRCFNCGKEDHRLADCPEPRNKQRIEENRRKFLQKKKKKTSQRTGGSNESTSPPTNLTLEDRLKIPPGEGQKHMKVIGNRGSEKCVKWCDTCKHWGDHLTVDHRDSGSPTQTTNTTSHSTSSNDEDESIQSERTSYAQMIRSSLPSSDIGRPDF